MAEGLEGAPAAARVEEAREVARAAAVMEASVAAEMVVVVMAVVVMAVVVSVHHLEARVTVRVAEGRAEFEGAAEEMEAATAEGGRGEA